MYDWKMKLKLHNNKYWIENEKGIFFEYNKDRQLVKNTTTKKTWTKCMLILEI
jgi:hypothetical protein